MNFLPSQRFSLILLAVILSVGIIYSVLPGERPVQTVSLNAEIFKEQTQKVGNLVPLESPALRQVAEADTDGDGLNDWEERLWKTDPSTKDTDKDGTNDGDEVGAGRNPLVKGPRDSIRETVSLAAAYQKDAPLAEQNLSPTDKVAREFFSKYLSLKQSGGELSPVAERDLLIETVQLAASETTPLKTYSSDSFKTSTSNTPESLHVYGNLVGETMRRHSFATESELVLFARVLENGDLSAFTNLEKIADSYDFIVADLVAMTVPSTALTAHTFLTNQVSAIAETVHGLGLVQTDPVSSLVAFANYEERAAGLALSIRDVQNFLLNAGIVFEPSETGYLLSQTGTSL
jgi:hypothetical protein